MPRTENLHILEMSPLVTPEELKHEIPADEDATRTVAEGRRAIQNILTGEDDRLIAIVGPCSLHDVEASLDYARRLARTAAEVDDRVLIVMRAYFEKPRTTIGWKGMLYDPHLNHSDDINEGVRRSRRLLRDINALGLPTATEILDPIVPQYLCDLISWASIGARTSESQIHRQMASGLSMPIGFKNATDGNLAVACEAILAASRPHAFLGIDGQGKVAVAATTGNPFGHLVLRGGATGPNYEEEYVAFAEAALRKRKQKCGVIIDCSHGNSGKDPKRQATVLESVLTQRAEGARTIAGVMLESFIEEGSQPIPRDLGALRYGVSITDACMGWEETDRLLRGAARP